MMGKKIGYTISTRSVQYYADNIVGHPTEVLDEFLFADDVAKATPTEEKMQNNVDQVSDSCDSYDFTISIKMTAVVYQ